ncbi:MAG: hypothetical protein KGY56_03140 [Desulfobacterales bacterium]|nr:hypothetical protein [Desulfobacterales bacterium]
MKPNAFRFILPLTLLLVLVMPASGFSQDRYEIGLRVNNSAIEAIAAMEYTAMPGKMRIDANGLYEDDLYKMIGTSITFGDEVITPGLTGRLGFRGVLGDFDRPGKDSNLVAAAFVLGADYDLSSAYISYYIPLILHADVNIGPSPICFDDTEEYIEANFGVDWMIIQNAALMLHFRFLEAEFEDPVKWQENDRAVYAGVKFRF